MLRSVGGGGEFIHRRWRASAPLASTDPSGRAFRVTPLSALRLRRAQHFPLRLVCERALFPFGLPGRQSLLDRGQFGARSLDLDILRRGLRL